MALTSGSKLGPYEILSPLGAGGMGEVYRARDTRLDRDVAIKVLPEQMARDKERVLRFEREAKLLATLNHPNIAAIHGFEDSAGKKLLVMEYVEGETLSQRLKRGPLPIDEALETGKQIAEALEAAHEKGVIHRDLKPGNVIVRPDGTVKVLDFGLARAMTDEASGAVVVGDSPTITAHYTRPGVVLGTAAYMSPEQARGKALDRRTDIWSFGCVLFECLTGTGPFAGETTTDVIARIMERDPDYDVLPERTPPRIRDLVRRCLEKPAKRRCGNWTRRSPGENGPQLSLLSVATHRRRQRSSSRSRLFWRCCWRRVTRAGGGAGSQSGARGQRPQSRRQARS
jgi:eukaryotic-like serine/threonine-protein kinase